MIRRLDLDVAIYRDRVQVVHRGSEAFIDQPAEFPFSDEHSVVANAANLEDTIVRAVRRILAEGGYSLNDPIAHVTRCDGCLGQEDRTVVEKSLAGLGIGTVVWEVDQD